MTAQIFADARPFFFEHELFAVHEVVDRHALHLEVDCFGKSALPKTRKMQRRFAQRFRGNRSGIHARAAEDGLALDQCDAFAEIGRLRRPLFSGRTGADDDEVVHELSRCQVVRLSTTRQLDNLTTSIRDQRMHWYAIQFRPSL